MKKLFGTDGVRGIANRELTPELAYRIGRAGGYLLGLQGGRKGIVVGRDTRISGHMLEGALIAGICSVGVDVYRLGIMPTPGVAYLTRSLEQGGGAVISASHNPFGDNGIKFFGFQGKKLTDQVEARIEALIMEQGEIPSPIGQEVGQVYDLADGEHQYIDYIKKLFNFSLAGYKVVVDCANGAAYRLAPRVLEELGAEVIPLFTEPDGININANCGSTYPQALIDKVLEEKAQLGLALDGDADRVLAVDEEGQLVDGDQIMVMMALALKAQNAPAWNKIVVTVMSNLGLHQAMKEAGIQVLETQVGDRYVLEKMEETGALLGGEQSGHIIYLPHNSTGDGLLTALNILQIMAKEGKPLSQLAGQMNSFPQILKNVSVKDKEVVLNHEKLKIGIEEMKNRLANRGRILVRPSGTEPLIRVMAEGPEERELEEIATQLVNIIIDCDNM